MEFCCTCNIRLRPVHSTLLGFDFYCLGPQLVLPILFPAWASKNGGFPFVSLEDHQKRSTLENRQTQIGFQFHWTEEESVLQERSWDVRKKKGVSSKPSLYILGQATSGKYEAESRTSIFLRPDAGQGLSGSHLLQAITAYFQGQTAATEFKANQKKIQTNQTHTLPPTNVTGRYMQ